MESTTPNSTQPCEFCTLLQFYLITWLPRVCRKLTGMFCRASQTIIVDTSETSNQTSPKWPVCQNAWHEILIFSTKIQFPLWVFDTKAGVNPPTFNIMVEHKQKSPFHHKTHVETPRQQSRNITDRLLHPYGLHKNKQETHILADFLKSWRNLEGLITPKHSDVFWVISEGKHCTNM